MEFNLAAATDLEARANRPIYTGNSSLNDYATVNTAALLTKRATFLFAMLEYEQLGEEISASPLLEEEKIISVFLGYGWQF